MTVPSGDGLALADTNVVIYAYDQTEVTKHEIARQLLRELSDAGRLVYTTQVLNEFCSVALRPKSGLKLSLSELAMTVRELVATGLVIALSEHSTLRALDAVATHGLSFWDALIWAAARENGVATIYTEDFQHGRVIEGVRFVNPFQAAP